MNWQIYHKQQRSKCIKPTVNKQNDFFLDNGKFSICNCLSWNGSRITVCHSFFEAIFSCRSISVCRNGVFIEGKLLFVSTWKVLHGSCQPWWIEQYLCANTEAIKVLFLILIPLLQKWLHLSLLRIFTLLSKHTVGSSIANALLLEMEQIVMQTRMDKKSQEKWTRSQIQIPSLT